MKINKEKMKINNLKSEIRKMKRNIEILKRKKQSIEDSKFARNENFKVGDDTERFMLNMEMLTWIVNTDSLLLSISAEYKSNKMNFMNRRDGSDCHGILLGLYYAFNCFKHSMQIESMEKINESPFFETEHTKYTIANNVWLNTSTDTDKFYKYYKDYLVDKNVFETFSMAIHFLNKQYEIINTKKQEEVNTLENKQEV